MKITCGEFSEFVQEKKYIQFNNKRSTRIREGGPPYLKNSRPNIGKCQAHRIYSNKISPTSVHLSLQKCLVLKDRIKIAFLFNSSLLSFYNFKIQIRHKLI